MKSIINKKLRMVIIITAGVDYWITEICRKSESESILLVKIYRADSQSRADAGTMSKTTVVGLIESGARIYTCPDNSCNKENGAEVRVYPHGGSKYLRSVPDDVARDNLGSLPNFC